MFAHQTEDQDTCPGERIATPRLVLRKPAMNDAAALVSLANNKNIVENTASLPYPYGLKDAEAWIERTHDRPADKGRGFVICLKDETETLIGCGGWAEVPTAELPQIGYWVGEPYWGKGYATEAAHCVVDHAFTLGQQDRIGAGCRVTNVASRRVIEKCGFQYDGLGMIQFRFHNGSLPILKYQMDRATWASLKAWGAQ